MDFEKIKSQISSGDVSGAQEALSSSGLDSSKIQDQLKQNGIDPSSMKEELKVQHGEEHQGGEGDVKGGDPAAQGSDTYPGGWYPSFLCSPLSFFKNWS